MALDPLFLNFGLNLGREFAKSSQIAVENAAITAQNAVAVLNGVEQDGYLAVNYGLDKRERDNLQLEVAIKALQAKADAKVNAAAHGLDSKSAQLTIARQVGKTETQVQHEANTSFANYKNTQKGILANSTTSQRITKYTPGIADRIRNAGTQSYMDALKSGLIK